MNPVITYIGDTYGQTPVAGSFIYYEATYPLEFVHPCRASSTTKHEILITERESTDYTVDGVDYQVVTVFATSSDSLADTDFNFVYQDQVDLNGNVILSDNHCDEA